MSEEFPTNINFPIFESIQKTIRLFTDGGYSRKRGIGACAFIVVEGDKTIIHSDSCGYKSSTSNRMEIQAAIDSLEWAIGNMPDYRVILFSDSKYVLGIPGWSRQWELNGWKTSGGSPVKNKDLVSQYVTAVYASNNFASHWLAGHDGHQFNEMADTLVGIAMDDMEDDIVDDGDHWDQVRSDIEDRPLW